MKKLSLLFVAFVCAASAVFAQSSDLKVTPLNGSMNAFRVGDATIVGRDGNKTYLVTHNTISNSLAFIDKDCAVLLIDDDMKIISQCMIPDTRESDIRAAHMYNGKVYILMSGTKKKTVSFTRYIVDVNKMQLEGEPTVIRSYTMERRDDAYSWVEQSPDKSATALVSIFVNEKKEKLDATEILLDEEMNIEWQRDYPIHALNDMVVTDNGEIVTIGNTRYEKGVAGRLYVSVINADNAQDFYQDVDVSVSSSRIVSYKNGVALGMGLGTSVKNRKEIKFFGYAINTQNGSGNVSVKTFSTYEKDVFDNSDYGDNSDDPDLDKLVMRECLATDRGGVGSIQMRWIETRCNSQGSCANTYYTQGAVVFAVDNNGEILWHQPVRSSAKAGMGAMISYRICVNGDNVYVLQSEGPKANNDMRYELKEFGMKKGSKKVGLYTISGDGSISKEIIEIPEKAILMGDVSIVDGYFTGYVCTFNKAASFKLKVK